MARCLWVVLAFTLTSATPGFGQEETTPPMEVEQPDAAAPPVVVYGERVGVGTAVLVPKGQTRRGDVVAIMAPATVEGDVDGDVVNVLGRLRLAGRVDGDVVAVLSDVELADSAEIRGEFVQVLGGLRDDGAEIGGEHVSIPNVVFSPRIGPGFDGLVALWLWFRAALLIAGFFGIFALGALLPGWTLDGSEEISRRPLIALLVGAGLQVAALPLLVILLFLSIVGILLIPFVVVAYLAVLALGYATVMHWIGDRIGRAAGRTMSVLGALALGFLVLGVLFFVPVLGTLLWIVAAWLGVGALALSRIGREVYTGTPRPAPPAPSVATGPPGEATLLD